MAAPNEPIVNGAALGMVTDFSKLRGKGRLALLYGLALVFIIVPLTYLISWLFHRGMLPPAPDG